MAACSRYVKRFRTALEYRKTPFPQQVIDLIGKRATSDRELDGILLSVLQIIEPPYCQKSHCPMHTTSGFCGCSKNLVPGRCPLNLEYLKRKREKAEKAYQTRIKQIPQRFFPLSKENEEKVRSMETKAWNKAIKNLK